MELPSHLTEADVREAAQEADSMLDFQRSIRVGRHTAREIAREVGVEDEIPESIRPTDLEA